MNKFIKSPLLLLFFSLLAFSSVNSKADVTIVRNAESLLPLKHLEKNRITIVSIGEPSDNLFTDYCRRYCSVKAEDSSDFTVSKLSSEQKEIGEIVIATIFSSCHQSIETFRTLNFSRNVIAVFFVPDNEVSRFADCGKINTLICTDGVSDKNLTESAEVIFGGITLDSKLHQDIPGVAKKGDGVSIHKSRLGYLSPGTVGFSDKLITEIDSIVSLNIKKRSFPGCQIVVAKNGYVVVDKAYGTLDYSAGSKAVDRSTLYDIASMTKATATIAGLMKAYDKGLFDLDQPASKYLPRLRNTDKSNLTVRDFLYHTTGIPATVNTYSLMVDSSSFSGKLIQYKSVSPYTVKLDKGVYGHSGAKLRSDLFKTTKSKGFEIEIAKGIFGGEKMVERMRNAIYDRKLGEKKYKYSCLNFCILMDMEEALTGVPHEKWVNSIFSSIGASLTMFRPSDKSVNKFNIAPTENDRFMRKQHLKGYVHDEMAAYLGGVSGNAGLFSTAGNIAKLCQMWLNGGTYGDVDVLSSSTVRLFTTDKNKAIDRGLGFDYASRIKSMESIGMPESTFGHTGFTGTCFWIDPENEIIVVILTNRVNPSRDNPSFTNLNPRNSILKAVYDSLVSSDN